MLLSRFWYLILSFALAGAVGVLYVAHGFYNRHTERWMNDALAADASSVAWYLKDDARNRAAALLPVSLNPELRESLAKANDANEVPQDLRDKARQALSKAFADIKEDPTFYTVFAVDADGRVIAQAGSEWNAQHKNDWNIGGHAVVADALAGWIRDDAWVWQGKMFRVVARPVERNGGGAPVGAIVGITAVDAAYAQRVANKTGARVAFYVLGSRDVYALPERATKEGDVDPEEFQKPDFDVMTGDIKEAAGTPEYLDLGRSAVRRPREDIGLLYTRVPGEAWDLGCGYIVARKVVLLKTPLSFFERGTQTDKDRAPRNILIAIAIGLGLLGILFSIVEHTLPLRAFQRVAHEFGVGKVDTLAPSKFRGVYKKIAADINDGVDKNLSKGGITRRAADLEQVIGPLPAQPQMSAFAVPEASAISNPNLIPDREKSVPRVPGKTVPRVSEEVTGSIPVQAMPIGDEAETVVAAAPAAAPVPAPIPPPPAARPSGEGAGRVPPPRGRAAPPPAAKPPPPATTEVEPASQPMSTAMSVAAPATSGPSSPTDEMAEWKVVFEEFVKTKKQCGESTEGLTFERFKGTLERNKAALVARHNCTFVKFTVYVKDGKAALRASPVKP